MNRTIRRKKLRRKCPAVRCRYCADGRQHSGEVARRVALEKVREAVEAAMLDRRTGGL